MSKVTELGAHDPSVESVISRLNRHEGRIKTITVVVGWDDDSADVFHCTRPVQDLCYDSVLLNKYVQGFVGEQDED